MKKVSTFAAAFHVETSFLFWRASFERKNFVWPLLSGRMEAALAYVCTMYVKLLQQCKMATVAKLSRCTCKSGECALNGDKFNLFQVNK